MVTFFEEFPRNFSRIISWNWLLGNFREIPQNWSPRWEIFVGSQFRDSVSRNSWEILWNFSPQNSSELLGNTSLEIPEKFLGLGHHVYWFLVELNKRINSTNFNQRNSWEIILNASSEIPEKFLGLSQQVYGFLGELNKRINIEKFLGFFWNFNPRNSWEILLNASPEIPEKFLRLGQRVYGSLGELNKRISTRNSWEFLWIFSQEIPKNFSGIFLLKFLRNFQDFISEFSSSVFLQ